MIPNELSKHYQIVIRDLQAQRDTLAAQLSDLDAVIASIQRVSASAQVPSGFTSPTRVYMPTPRPLPGISYKHMSVRWSVLAFLYQSGPAKTADIVAGLRAGGMEREGLSFTNSVSAVVSQLKVKSPAEVQTVDDGLHALTAVGREMWESIRNSPKFRETQLGPQQDSLIPAEG